MLRSVPEPKVLHEHWMKELKSVACVSVLSIRVVGRVQPEIRHCNLLFSSETKDDEDVSRLYYILDFPDVWSNALMKQREKHTSWKVCPKFWDLVRWCRSVCLGLTCSTKRGNGLWIIDICGRKRVMIEEINQGGGRAQTLLIWKGRTGTGEGHFAQRLRLISMRYGNRSFKRIGDREKEKLICLVLFKMERFQHILLEFKVFKP